MSRQPLHFDSLSFLEGDRRVFLISGELHYFRVPRAGWRDRLEKLKAAGGNCVAKPAKVLRQALGRLGWSPVVHCDNPNIWTSLLSDGQHHLLFLLNLFTGVLTANVAYTDPASGRVIEPGPQTLPGISVRVIP